MSHSSSNNNDFHVTQYNDAHPAKHPNCTRTEKEEESAFRIAEERYAREHGKRFRKELIILMIKKDIFESALRKLELAVALPSIISDPDLSAILTVDEANAIKNVSLRENEFTTNLSRSASTNCERTHDTSRLDRATCKALKILQGYIGILCTKPRYKEISTSSALFLQRIRHFLEQYASYRMYRTPEEAMSEELHYRKLWRSRKKCIEDAATITAELKRQEAEHRKELEDVIKRHKNLAAVDEIGRECDEDITSTTVKHEKKQLGLYKVCEYEQRSIQSALENLLDDLASLKSANANVEQAAHKRRMKAESQLLAIIAKYDAEIGGRQEMMQELNETNEHDTVEKHALKEELEQQAEILAACIERKAEAEIRLSRSN